MDTPTDIRAEAIRDLYKAYNSAFSNKKNGNITKFQVGFRKKHKSQSIVIPKTAIPRISNRKISIYPRKLSDIRISKDKCMNNIELKYDCRLQFEYNQWYLCIPICINKKQNTKYNASCALDPGERKIHTIYSEQAIYKIPLRKEILKKYQDKLDKLQSLRAKSWIKKKSWSKKSMRIYKRISNLVDDIHYAIINEITNNYNTIYLPKFESQELVKVVCNKNVRRNLLSLKHYKFQMRLKHVCESKYVKLKICKEDYTTKICTKCGFINNIRSKEIYECQNCKLVIDRDVNGGRNIYIKNECA
jgi:putative transposase